MTMHSNLILILVIVHWQKKINNIYGNVKNKDSCLKHVFEVWIPWRKQVDILLGIPHQSQISNYHEI